MDAFFCADRGRSILLYEELLIPGPTGRSSRTQSLEKSDKHRVYVNDEAVRWYRPGWVKQVLDLTASYHHHFLIDNFF